MVACGDSVGEEGGLRGGLLASGSTRDHAISLQAPDSSASKSPRKYPNQMSLVNGCSGPSGQESSQNNTHNPDSRDHNGAFMEMKITFGNPILIFVYSLALLLLGGAVGIFWRTEPITAFSIALLGASFMVIHDTFMTSIWIWVAARWVQAVRDQNKPTHR
jgi:hypothetical protein